ncbi:unnamed protein product [Spirodela intermedia]|uniref:Uncharacterized protein n=1 Tax=Spirodela intermedia TaxID=51605 RepID=A0A7I8JPU0_SPIIN|nr:unnamed protein product [Spirodela intermedia]CAA6672166.1 unnamed protein product [Spirodela intermedia]
MDGSKGGAGRGGKVVWRLRRHEHGLPPRLRFEEVGEREEEGDERRLSGGSPDWLRNFQVSSRLPLVISDKVHRSKALVECDDESIDLSGDVGAVGRIVISENSNDSHEMLLDLKGTIYKTAIVPSRTFCVVSFGQSEAKVCYHDDFVQLKPHSSVFEAETVIEGVLDGFSFDMDDEGDRAPKSSAYQGAMVIKKTHYGFIPLLTD